MLQRQLHPQIPAQNSQNLCKNEPPMDIRLSHWAQVMLALSTTLVWLVMRGHGNNDAVSNRCDGQMVYGFQVVVAAGRVDSTRGIKSYCCLSTLPGFTKKQNILQFWRGTSSCVEHRYQSDRHHCSNIYFNSYFFQPILLDRCPTRTIVRISFNEKSFTSTTTIHKRG